MILMEYIIVNILKIVLINYKKSKINILIFK